MMRRTPLKRGKGKPPTTAEKRHHDRVAGMGCCVCGSPATIHHVTASVEGGRISRSHKLVVPLCPRHHQIQFGPTESVEALSHRGFFAEYGIDLLALAEMLWAASERQAA